MNTTTLLFCKIQLTMNSVTKMQYKCYHENAYFYKGSNFIGSRREIPNTVVKFKRKHFSVNDYKTIKYDLNFLMENNVIG